MIVNRNGRFGVSIYDASFGRKRWVGTFATKREAKDAERAAATRRGVGSNLTCGEFAERWLIEYARPAAATRRNYSYAIRQFITDLGRARLADLDRPRARAWALTQPQSRVRAARALFNDAINDGLHPGPNPFANLRMEQSRGRRDLVALTEAELHALADVAFAVHGDYGPTFRAMVLFGM